MQDALLPLFPLQLVLFPLTPLPLHIFEDRYKEMIGDVTRENSEFGVVQAGEKGIVNTGCSASIEKVLNRYPDGRLDILVVGRRRFEIMELNDEKPYLRGAVQFFDDEDEQDPPREAQMRVLEGFSALKNLESSNVAGELRPGDPHFSFQIAQAIGDLTFRQVLLATRSEAERIKRLADFLPVYVEKQKHLSHMKDVAPRNGHGKMPQGIS
jgi:Lon protease-like protein